MAQNFSTDFKRQLNQINPSDRELYLLEINHTTLLQPIRLVSDNQDVVSNSNNYLACAFSITIPDDGNGRVPTAQLEIDNTSRMLSVWIEKLMGGYGLTATIKIVKANNPNLVEYQITLDFNNISVTSKKITGTLGFEDTLNKPAISYNYRPEFFKGLV
jgi:hypothetical protein